MSAPLAQGMKEKALDVTSPLPLLTGDGGDLLASATFFSPQSRATPTSLVSYITCGEGDSLGSDDGRHLLSRPVSVEQACGKKEVTGLLESKLKENINNDDDDNSTRSTDLFLKDGGNCQPKSKKPFDVPSIQIELVAEQLTPTKEDSEQLTQDKDSRKERNNWEAELKEALKTRMRHSTSSLLEIPSPEQPRLSSKTRSPLISPKIAPSPAEDASFKPLTLDQLTMGPLIGSGRTGTVWSALIKATGQQVACKKISAEYVSSAEVELSTLEHLPRHPSIISYLGHNWIAEGGEEIDGTVWEKGLVIIMEFMPGASLRTTLEQFGAFDITQIRHVTIQILQGLCLLHEEGICHRDLKSANVLLGRDGEARLCDFGTAKLAAKAEPTEPASTMSWDIAGTVLWMAPEVITAKGYDCSSDIWALGCVVYEMSFNELPWVDRNFDNELAALSVIGFQEVTPLERIRSNERVDVDPRLWDFLELCFRRDASKRPSALELLESAFLVDSSDLFDSRTNSFGLEDSRGSRKLSRGESRHNTFGDQPFISNFDSSLQTNYGGDEKNAPTNVFTIDLGDGEPKFKVKMPLPIEAVSKPSEKYEVRNGSTTILDSYVPSGKEKSGERPPQCCMIA